MKVASEAVVNSFVIQLVKFGNYRRATTTMAGKRREHDNGVADAPPR